MWALQFYAQWCYKQNFHIFGMKKPIEVCNYPFHATWQLKAWNELPFKMTAPLGLVDAASW